MVDVDSLSDAEIRTKLIEFGYPVMPITGTTRNTMVKKLKLLLDNQNKIKKDDRRSLGRYSSEDESDTDATRTVKKRTTIGGALLHPPNPSTTTKLGARKINPPITTPTPKESRITQVTTRTEKIIRNTSNNIGRDDYDTGSESDDIDDNYQETKKSFMDNYRTSPNNSNSNRSMNQSPTRLPSCYLSASTAADNLADRLNKIRSRYSTSYDKPLYTSSPNMEDTTQDKENTPFLSNFTKTLSQLKESPRNSSNYDYKNDLIKEDDSNNVGNSGGARNYLSSYRHTTARSRSSIYNNHNLSTNDYNNSGTTTPPPTTTTTSNIIESNLVPFLVLFIAVIFFTIIGLVYIGIKSDSPYEISAAVPRCDNNDTTIKMEIYRNCVYEKDIKNAKFLLKVIKNELDQRFVHNCCVNKLIKPYMIEDDIIKFVQTKYRNNRTNIVNDLRNLQVLLFYNQHWGVKLIQLQRDGDEINDNALDDMEAVNTARISNIIALLSTNPSIPWGCYLYNLGRKLINFIILSLSLIFVLLLINYFYKYYKQYYQQQQDEEIAMVENIIDILQTNCTNNTTNIDNNSGNNDYIVINHVRDMIIPINERKKKERTWARVVKYINENESRIRTEIQIVRGEPSEVWRWLGGPAINASKNKVWQGQAFETQSGSVNSLNCSPTPCLKIRGMVEDGDRNITAIKKAVLSKLAQQCRILHCGVDKDCVYLKCADRSDALIAYRNLHGWWYAGNLVTVKYLKLERYMQRFPDSPVTGPPYLQ